MVGVENLFFSLKNNFSTRWIPFLARAVAVRRSRPKTGLRGKFSEFPPARTLPPLRSIYHRKIGPGEGRVPQRSCGTPKCFYGPKAHKHFGVIQGSVLHFRHTEIFDFLG